MTEERIHWTSREKRKQFAFVGLLCLSSAVIAFAPRNERRLFTVPEQPGSMQTLVAPQETLSRSDVFGPIDGFSGEYGQPAARGFFASVAAGGTQTNPMARSIGAVSRLASAAASSAAIPPSAMSAVPGAEQVPSALFAQPVVESPAASALPAAAGAAGGNAAPAAGAQPLPLVPPAAGNPQTPPQQPGPVPEPGSWLMMLGGFGIAGWFMRRRAKSATAAAA